MWTRQYKKRNTGRLIVPTFCAAFLTYFGFHAFQGDYGIYSKFRLEAATAEMRVEFNTLHNYRNTLEQRVQLLHDGTLDKDMLDEQARKSLNLTKADEVVIMRPIENSNIN